MEASNRTGVVAGLFALAGVVVGAGLVIIQHQYAKKNALTMVPTTSGVHDTSNDPPVIMHGGSFNLYLQLDAQPITGPPVVIDDNDVTYVSFSSAYTAMGPAPAPPSKLPAPWEVDVCNAAPGADKLCQPPGIKVAVAPNSVMTVDILAGTKYNFSTVPPPPLDYYPYSLLAADSSQIHPGYLVIQSGGQINDYQCSAVNSGNWADCLIQLGRYTSTHTSR